MKESPQSAKKKKLVKEIKRDKWLYIFLFPIIIYLVIFKYVPMLGTVMAFQDFKFSTGFLGSKWVGLDHFRRLFKNNGCLLYTSLSGVPNKKRKKVLALKYV